jgi:hypothetical protein
MDDAEYVAALARAVEPDADRDAEQ